MGAVNLQKHNSVENNQFKALKTNKKQYDDLLRLIVCAVLIFLIPTLFISPIAFLGFTGLYGIIGTILYGILRFLGLFKSRGTHPVVIVGTGVVTIFAVLFGLMAFI